MRVALSDGEAKDFFSFLRGKRTGGEDAARG